MQLTSNSLLKISLLTSAALLSACGGGGGGSGDNTPQTGTSLTIDNIVGNWYKSCGGSPGVHRLDAPDAKGYRAPLPTSADITLNISKSAVQADTLEVLVTYGIYPNDSCTGTPAFKFMAATKDNTGAYTGSPEQSSVASNQGPETWSFSGTGEATDPRPEGTTKLAFTKFSIVSPKQYFGKPDWPNEEAGIGHIWGDWLFPRADTNLNNYTVVSIANEAAMSQNGQPAGNIETFMTTGTSPILPPKNPGSWDQAISFLFGNYTPGWGYKKLSN